MGYITMHSYNDKTKKWVDITPENLFISSYKQLDSYWDYRFNLNADIHHLEKYSLLRDIVYEKGEWFEKVVFKLITNVVIPKKDIPKLIEAFELLNFRYSNEYSSEMISYLKNLFEYSSDNLILSFGHSTGGFWGTDGEHIINSITAKLPDSIQDRIYENTNMCPFLFGQKLFL